MTPLSVVPHSVSVITRTLRHGVALKNRLEFSDTDHIKEETMAFELPPLPYDRSALEPVISSETIDFHYGKHHQAYVDNLNKMTADTAWATQTLKEVILGTEGAMFNNAAQVWNHTFYWHGLSPNGGGRPAGALAQRLESAFGSFDDFKESFSAAAIGRFGSGWAWLVKQQDGGLAVTTTANAECPLTDGATPLLTCDVWEHAYYIDYRNARPRYVEKFWDVVNWDFVESNLDG
jgi:Fe-Mn family superoxide dismutase